MFYLTQYIQKITFQHIAVLKIEIVYILFPIPDLSNSVLYTSNSTSIFSPIFVYLDFIILKMQKEICIPKLFQILWFLFRSHKSFTFYQHAKHRIDKLDYNKIKNLSFNSPQDSIAHIWPPHWTAQLQQ